MQKTPRSDAKKIAALHSGGGGAYDLGFTGTAFTGGDGANGMAIVEEFA
ncbi:hypothetical protein G9445_06875 [Escherichia coli]|nr:hypothetical protein [Escherichia coli]